MEHTSSDAQFFGQEKIWKILLRIAPPVMLAQLIQALYNIVDSLFVGRYAESGLTALSIIYPIIKGDHIFLFIIIKVQSNKLLLLKVFLTAPAVGERCGTKRMSLCSDHFCKGFHFLGSVYLLNALSNPVIDLLYVCLRWFAGVSDWIKRYSYFFH